MCHGLSDYFSSLLFGRDIHDLSRRGPLLFCSRVFCRANNNHVMIFFSAFFLSVDKNDGLGGQR